MDNKCPTPGPRGQPGHPAGLPDQPAGHKGRPGAVWLRAWLWGERAWHDFLYLLLPGECVACGREDHSLCPACSAELRTQTAGPYRAEQSADALVGVGGESHLPVIAAGEYRDVLSAAILGFKNHGRTELAAPLGRGLARALECAGPPAAVPERAGSPMPGPTLLVPIPSTGSGWRRRGYDPVALLLRTLTREGRLPPELAAARVLGSKIKLPGRRRHQKGLGRAARRNNVRNTFKIKAGWRRKIRPSANRHGQTVLLLDDVLTTGSTLREATKTLEKAGFVVCGAVVLAAARAPEGNTQITPMPRLAQNSFDQKMNKRGQ